MAEPLVDEAVSITTQEGADAVPGRQGDALAVKAGAWPLWTT